jgi:hypothetical protein
MAMVKNTFSPEQRLALDIEISEKVVRLLKRAKNFVDKDSDDLLSAIDKAIYAAEDKHEYYLTMEAKDYE